MSKVDVAERPPELKGGHRTMMRLVLVVIAVLVSIGSLVSLCVIAFGVSSIRVVTDTQALPTTTRVLDINTGDVPVDVRLVTDADVKEPRVDLRLVTRGDGTHLAVAENAADSRVTLSDSGSGFLWFNRTGEIKVVLPPDLAQGMSVTVNNQARSIA